MSQLDVDGPDISELVTEDDEPVDNFASEKGQRLLTSTLYSSWAGPPKREGEAGPRTFLAAANVGLFAAVRTLPLVPDVFVSLDVEVHPDFWEKKHRTYLFWEFGKPPDLVIEIVSNRKGKELSKKRAGYARMRVTNYVVWDPYGVLGEEALQAFELRGDLYQAMSRPFFEVCELGLTLWDGTFEGVETRWLRWVDREGRLLPTPDERRQSAEDRAASAEDRAASAEDRAASAEDRAASAEGRAASAEDRAASAEGRAASAEDHARRMAEKLQALGIDPESV